MDLKIILTIVAMTLTGGYFVWEMGDSIVEVDSRLEEVEKTQRKVVDWLDMQIQRQRSAEAQRELLKRLCAEGRLPVDGPECKAVQHPPMR